MPARIDNLEAAPIRVQRRGQRRECGKTRRDRFPMQLRTFFAAVLLSGAVIAQGQGVGTLPNVALDAGGGQIASVAGPGDQVLRSEWVSNGITEKVETTRRANESADSFSKRHDELVDARRRVRPPDPVQHGEHFNGIIGEMFVSTWTNTEAGLPTMTTTLETYRYQEPLEPGNEWRIRHGSTLRVALRYLPGKS